MENFPSNFINYCIHSVLDSFYTPKVPIMTVPKKEVMIVLPFLGPISYAIKRKLCRWVHKFYPTVQLRVVFKRGLTIQNMFSFKDNFPLKCRSGVVYYVQCSKCGPSKAYIGKTKNTVFERFYGSGGHLNPHTEDSALLGHLIESGDPECDFVFNDIKILDSCSPSRDLQLKFIESIILKFEKQSLNTCD